jgi:hypothetical protein
MGRRAAGLVVAAVIALAAGDAPGAAPLPRVGGRAATPEGFEVFSAELPWPA